MSCILTAVRRRAKKNFGVLHIGKQQYLLSTVEVSEQPRFEVSFHTREFHERTYIHSTSFVPTHTPVSSTQHPQIDAIKACADIECFLNYGNNSLGPPIDSVLLNDTPGGWNMSFLRFSSLLSVPRERDFEDYATST